MRKIFLISAFMLLFSFSLISAYGPVGEKGISVEVVNGTIKVVGYSVVQDWNGLNTKVTLDNFFINKVTGYINNTCEAVSVPIIINGTYSGVNQTITPNVITASPYYADIPFIGQNITNASTLFCIDQTKYESCLDEKAKYSAALDACVKVQNDLIGADNLYDQCQLSLTTCQNDKANSATQVTTLTDEAEKTKNQKWLFGVIGLAAGIFGTLWNKGYIGKPKAPNPDANYNRGQAG